MSIVNRVIGYLFLILVSYSCKETKSYKRPLTDQFCNVLNQIDKVDPFLSNDDIDAILVTSPVHFNEQEGHAYEIKLSKHSSDTLSCDGLDFRLLPPDSFHYPETRRFYKIYGAILYPEDSLMVHIDYKELDSIVIPGGPNISYKKEYFFAPTKDGYKYVRSEFWGID